MTTIAPPRAWPLTRERPPVVIAIAHHRRVDLLEECIGSLRAHTGYPHHRICVLDQGSSDQSTAYLRSLMPDVDVVFSPENIGFTLASNAIIDRYPGWDVVLLNDDTRVTGAWLTALVATATSADGIGLVGAKLVSPNGLLQEAGGEVFADGRVRARGRAQSAWDPRYQERRAVDYCSAACLYVKRAVLDRCGAFERVYEAGYYEDIDLAFKARAAGFKVVYEPRCTVVHHEHASYGPDAAGLLMQSHRDTFRARWAASLASCPAGPFDLADAGARPRLLLVTDLAPANTLSPRMRRIRQVIRALHGTFRIAYLNVVAQGFDRYAALVEELGAVPFYVPADAAPGVTGLDERELVRVNYFPLALCGGVDAALFLRDRYPASMLEATTVAVDVGMSADVASAATRTGASHFVVMNEPQRQQILTVMPGARCAILPPRGELTTSCPPAREARTDIVMLTDNVDGPAAAAALATMLRSVVPALRSRQPHARLRLAGGALTPGLLAELPDDVDVLSSAMPAGSVLDLARVVVVPQHWCSPDTLSNIAEARARAIPVVTSSTVGAIAGLGDGVDAVTVETPEAFVEQIDRAYADPWWWNGPATPPREDAAPSSDDLTRSLAAWACGDAVVAGKDSTVANRRLPSG